MNGRPRSRGPRLLTCRLQRLTHLPCLEAAHIKWHQAGGPDSEVNGLALCVLHHKLFDCGAYSLTLGRKVQISQLAHGTRDFSEWLLAFHGQPLRQPQSHRYLPEEESVAWHQREVFRGPAREATAL